MKNRKNLLVAVAAFICMSTNAAQSVCLEKASCIDEEFFAEGYWIALGYVDQHEKNDWSAMKSPYVQSIFKIQARLFNGQEKLSRKDYGLASKSLLSDKVWMSNLYREAGAKGISEKDFNGFVTDLLSNGRKLTDVVELSASPEKFQNKIVSFTAYGQLVLNKLMIFRSEIDLNPLVADYSAIGDSEKVKLVKKCGSVKKKCKIQVLGEVTETAPLIEIKLDESSFFNL